MAKKEKVRRAPPGFGGGKGKGFGVEGGQAAKAALWQGPKGF